jgi:hypothetical protein
MNSFRFLLLGLAVSVWIAGPSPVWAGGGNIPGELASCETSNAGGSAVSGEAAAEFDPGSNAVTTIHLKYSGNHYYFRAYIKGVDLNATTNEAACTLLNKPYDSNGDGVDDTTLNQKMIATLGFSQDRVFKIHKSSIDAPADSFGVVPAEPRGTVKTALFSITLYAEQVR